MKSLPILSVFNSIPLSIYENTAKMHNFLIHATTPKHVVGKLCTDSDAISCYFSISTV